MEIRGNAQRPAKLGPTQWFTGTVWVEEIVTPVAPARAASALVTFAPGARTAWHTHPLGQTLYVLSGLGWAQREGEDPELLRPGDVVHIPPGENHWHGAQAQNTMTHIAIQEADSTGSPVSWGRAVSEEEYPA